ncbi:MAG: PQQ-like beta-propeller repeat protein, partial [Candidatus Coatesbacteria bacterium]|nr:PQQ-like beta-propeller repeat protein [Candidatus Coatesbacteria bacterium]
MKARGVIYILVSVVGVLFAPWLAQAQGEAPWPMFQHDPGHTGVAPVVAPDLLTLRWKVGCELVSDSHHPVIGPGGTIWVVGPNRITSITSAGDVQKGFVPPIVYFAQFQSVGSGAVGDAGQFIGLASKTTGGVNRPAVLFSASPEGELEWALDLDGDTGNSSLLTLGPDGTIYVGLGSRQVADRNRLCAVSQDGELVWSYTPPGPVTTIPAVDAQGNVYFGCGYKPGVLYCVESGGALRWSFDQIPASSLDSAPTIDEAGNIYYFVNNSGLVELASDGTLKNHCPFRGYSWTSAVLLPGDSVGFICTNPAAPETSLFVRLGPDGQEDWRAQLSGSSLQCSPAADAAGNVFVSGKYGEPMDPFSYLVRLSPEGTLATIHTTAKSFICDVSGPCIGEDGTVYAYVGDNLYAFGEPAMMLDVGISTQWAGWDAQLGDMQSASIRLTNPGPAQNADCYVAYRRADGNDLFFYPFWSTSPVNCALQFRPLSALAVFNEIELAYIRQSILLPGEYEFLTALFKPDTYEPISRIASATFVIFAHPTERSPLARETIMDMTPQALLQGTPPTISIWTDRDSYSAGEVLDLSLSLENQDLGMMLDLYIAATLDADPTGTLYFFPTWATSPGMTNISFLPLAHGASLPSLTIMHLALPDALPKGGYRFLAAFFQVGTFNLASDI